MAKKIAITGMGIVSAIGNSVAENLNTLLNGGQSISRIKNLETIHQDFLKFGEIKTSDEEFVALLGLPEDNNFCRSALIGMYALKETVESANITKENINDVRSGLISATTVGGMDKTEKYFHSYDENVAARKYIEGHEAGDVTNKMAEFIGLKGFVTTISTACSSAANAILLGSKMIESGQLDRVIVGGTDALCKFTINGFKTLMILTDEENAPFDDNRKGLNLGEGAAYLVLESDEVVKKENRKVLAYVSGYGNANDAFHQTASSENGEGAYLAMQIALESAGLKPSDIDYVNVHGTATPNNDLSEGIAMQRIFGDDVPVFSSTKPFTGHTLAAAAAVEAVYSVLAIQNEVVYPNKNFKTPMKEFNLIPQTELMNKKLNHVLSNSFGFGGNCSTIIFSKNA